MPTSDCLKHPGFGLPVTKIAASSHGCRDEHSYFEHAIDIGLAISGVTLREKAMLDFVCQISDKPQWCEKVFSEEIVARWRAECGDEDSRGSMRDHKCFAYCIAELRDKAAYYQQLGVITVLDLLACVVKADAESMDKFWNTFQLVVQPLENVPNHLKGWHPGSNGVVLGIVHPSLYPVDYNQTRVLPYGKIPLEHCAAYTGLGEMCVGGSEHSTSTETGLRPYGSYHWPPSDVIFDESGRAKIEGYINNLHPERHTQLYSLLETAEEKAIPLWNECLLGSPTEEQQWGMLEPFYDNRERLQINVDQRSNQDFQRPNESPDDERRSLMRYRADELRLIQPNVEGAYVPVAERTGYPKSRPVDLLSDSPDGLQVIFKLANIRLTPNKPTFAGSNWHIEGALNELICATALFYYDQQNIEDSYLEFRQQIETDTMVRAIFRSNNSLHLCYQEADNAFAQILRAEQGQPLGAEYMCGIEQNGPPIQHLGRVLTRSHRILALPNVLQHRVTPFSLRDRTRPRQRRILAMVPRRSELYRRALCRRNDWHGGPKR